MSAVPLSGMSTTHPVSAGCFFMRKILNSNSKGGFTMFITIDLSEALAGVFVLAFDIMIICLALVLGALILRATLRLSPRFRKWFENLNREAVDE